MSEAQKNADNWASYEQNCDGPVEDTFFAGARALLEWARKCYHPDGNPAVLMAKLEAYFAEEE